MESECESAAAITTTIIMIIIIVKKKIIIVIIIISTHPSLPTVQMVINDKYNMLSTVIKFKLVSAVPDYLCVITKDSPSCGILLLL